MNKRYKDEMREVLKVAGIKPGVMEDALEDLIEVFNGYRRYMRRFSEERLRYEEELRKSDIQPCVTSKPPKKD